jgi:hypothetical protein
VTIDTENKTIIHNGKVIHVDPIYAVAMAPIGTQIEVIANDNGIVTLKLHIPE